LQELLKLPLLFQHYFEHKALDAELGFVTYLIDHYNSIPHTDNDEEQDNQLPFKSAGLDYIVTSPAVPVFHKYVLKTWPAMLIKQPAVYHEEDIPPPFPGTIWQPPKILIYSAEFLA
jgi:hypothetical protein